jgi:hypothetical protein
MKKNHISRVVTALCIATALLLGCEGSDDPTPQSCGNDFDAYDAAIDAYFADPSVSKCEALKSAANKLLDCPGITDAQEAEYKDAAAGFVCD